MRRALIVAALLLAPSGLAAGQTRQDASARPANAEQEVANLNQKWADSIAAGDVTALDRLFADDMILTAGDGTVRGKKEELDDLRPSPDVKTYFFKVEDVRVRVYGDAAVVTGHAKWKINLKGSDVDLERRYTSVLVRQQGEWRIVAQQLTKIAPPAK